MFVSKIYVHVRLFQKYSLFQWIIGPIHQDVQLSYSLMFCFSEIFQGIRTTQTVFHSSEESREI